MIIFSNTICLIYKQYAALRLFNYCFYLIQTA